MRKLTHPEILTLRSQNAFLPRTPVSICLNDVRSLYNVGSVFRTADGMRAEKLYLCGISGKPPERAITKTALGAETSVPWEYRRQAVPLLKELKAKGYQIVVMEHTTQSVSYADFKPIFPVCLVAGNEVSGVDTAIIDLADVLIDIPMLGEKNSLNVGVAMGIAAYHFLHHSKCGVKTRGV
ncbi:MAG: RNA methyltransferase [Candidatus Omnitrophica bacterium CG11_big_fil_rev_8_21_14_0_20_45_26]|uniref:RNA methyltransferase n=1 Tax=Candidatus Abzuiibacterium crystallinum TaxID=1974748 RepID=A0A2H0LN43_9BACT|nr:MAG: RNA methyltransferase [Candidatus Omnitrophica bacterium CG11_big_fil_rev_8_21_14_0_20_45_26]PIW65498.1 MAG: RNA methyltransferase [Candidatus Omnitrophica bacterium CG12_big_fil_rev_8_21_14_0_65_45_16]